MKRNKTVENIILVLLFVFASFGAYVLFANSSNTKDSNIEAKSLYVKKDFSKYNTAKPKLQKAKKVSNK